MSAKIVRFDEINSIEIKYIRTSVFVEEQNIDHDIDFDDKDESAIHVLVYDEDKAVGTARLLADGHIGRMAVLKGYRNLGKGSEALTALIGEAKHLGLKSVFLGAQLTAVGFYDAFGFVKQGNVFIEADIEHVEMKLTIY